MEKGRGIDLADLLADPIVVFQKKYKYFYLNLNASVMYYSD